ncbi:ATP-binding protein [Patescibacteria group bacterium]|nr:ATP-binding protein [Patescibacteria group bacterium]
MQKELILSEILAQNKHWKNDKSFFEHQKHKRKLFFELVKYVSDRQIISVVGLRRTGKTILLKQLIRHIIEQGGAKPGNVLFLSFDEVLVTSKLALKDYLDAFLENFLKKESFEKIYIFLDEIQYIDKWQHILKRYYDTHQNIKFVISGSSSLFLKKQTTESLAGRIYEFKLPPLSFEEFMELAGVSAELLLEYQKHSFSAGELILKHAKNDYSLFIARSGNILKDLFEEYLLYYQFPEMVLQEDKDKIRKYITESVYKKTIEYDIPKLFGVEKIDELKFLFQILVNENSSLIEFKTISSEAGIEENTLKKYISYFQESFLVDLLYNYSKSFRKSKRLQKKGYIASSNFFTAFRFDWTENPILRSQYFGSLVETYVFNLLKEKYQYLSFYRKGQDEVDFVASNDYRNSGAHALIEVKYTNEIKWNDIKFIDRIAKKIFKTRYLVYSKSEFKIEENKLIVPCFLIK